MTEKQTLNPCCICYWKKNESHHESKNNLCRVTWLQKNRGMGDDADILDIAAEHEGDEDLITLLYLLTLMLCVLMGQSAYACLWLIALLNVANMVCKL